MRSGARSIATDCRLVTSFWTIDYEYRPRIMGLDGRC